MESRAFYCLQRYFLYGEKYFSPLLHCLKSDLLKAPPRGVSVLRGEWANLSPWVWKAQAHDVNGTTCFALN